MSVIQAFGLEFHLTYPLHLKKEKRDAYGYPLHFGGTEGRTVDETSKHPNSTLALHSESEKVGIIEKKKIRTPI